MNSIPNNLYKQISQCMPIVCVDGVLKKGNKLALFKRTYEPFKDCWSLFGGRLLKNETIEEGLKRKAKEEIGVDNLEIITLLNVYNLTYEKGRYKEFDTHSVSLCYLVKTDDDIRLDKSSSSEFSDFKLINHIPKNNIRPYIENALLKSNIIGYIPKQIFTYWEGPMPYHIEYCLKTMKRSGVDVIILNQSNIDSYLNNTLCENWKKLNIINQKVDCLRIAVLYNHGGMWVDADTVFLKNCEHLFKEKGDMFSLKWSDDTFLNGYFIASPKSLFLNNALNMINDILSNNFKYEYNENLGAYLGEGIFEKIKKQISTINIPLSTFLPIEFRGKPYIWEKEESIEKYLTKDTVAIGLNFNIYKSNSNIEELCNQKNLFGSIFRYSKNIGDI